MTSFVDDLFGGLFPKKDNRVNIKENFTQSDTQKSYIMDWMDSEEGKDLMNLIQKNYHFKKSGMNSSPEIHILNSPYANGIAISFESPFTEETFSNLFFAFGRRMLDLGYQQISLDRKIEEIKENVRTTEKQYFKPPISNTGLTHKIDQLYGNISVEKVNIDDEPSFLKILVTIYSDHLYQEAKPFDHFIDSLFKS